MSGSSAKLSYLGVSRFPCMTASTQARSQDFAQDEATGHFQIYEIFQIRFFPYNAHRRWFVKVRQSSILSSVNKIAQKGAMAPRDHPLGLATSLLLQLGRMTSVRLWRKNGHKQSARAENSTETVRAAALMTSGDDQRQYLLARPQRAVLPCGEPVAYLESRQGGGGQHLRRAPCNFLGAPFFFA